MHGSGDWTIGRTPYGITRSAGTADPRPGLGLLAGSLCVDYHHDSVRRRAFREAVGFGFPPGYALDDHAGLLFRGTELAEAVSARPEAGAWRVQPAAGARAEEIPLAVRELTDPRPAIDEPAAELVELRRTRAARIARAVVRGSRCRAHRQVRLRTCRYSILGGA